MLFRSFASVATLPSAFAEVQERPEPPAVLRTRILRSVAVSTVLGVVVVLMTPVAPRHNGLEVSRVPIAVLMLVAWGARSGSTFRGGTPAGTARCIDCS